VAAKTRTIGGKDYKLVVLRVLERDAQGRPSKVELGHDDAVFKVEDGMEFFTAYVFADSVKPNPKRMN
jgi:hypothetical protein